MEKESAVYGVYMHQNHEGLRMFFRERTQVVQSTVSPAQTKHECRSVIGENTQVVH